MQCGCITNQRVYTAESSDIITNTQRTLMNQTMSDLKSHLEIRDDIDVYIVLIDTQVKRQSFPQLI